MITIDIRKENPVQHPKIKEGHSTALPIENGFFYMKTIYTVYSRVICFMIPQKISIIELTTNNNKLSDFLDLLIVM